MNTIDCTLAEHGAQILAILNEAIVTSTALYDYQPRPPQAMIAWFDAKHKGNFPVVGVVGDDGTLLGFASYGIFRNFPAFKYSIEHSVYVHNAHRGKGISILLMNELIARAQAQNYHLMVGCIDASNETSIALHIKLGFAHSGTITQAGFKFGRWLDAAFYQKVLATPFAPIDG